MSARGRAELRPRAFSGESTHHGGGSRRRSLVLTQLAFRATVVRSYSDCFPRL